MEEGNTTMSLIFFSYFSKSRSGTILCLKCSVAGISYFKDQAGGEKETGGYY